MLLLSVVVALVAGCAGDLRPVAGVVTPPPVGGEPPGADGLGGAGGPTVPEPPPRVVAAAVSPGRAVLLPAGDAPGLEPLTPAPRLVTPSVTVTVEAAAEWSFGPPGDGRVARAWHVRVAAPPPLAPPPDRSLIGDRDDLPPRDASTTLWLDTGSGRLPVLPTSRRDDPSAAHAPPPAHAPPADESRPAEAGLTLVRCDELPCRGPAPADHLLVAVTAADARPALIATVDGVDQRLELRSGELTSPVSRVGYDRPSVVPVAAAAWPPTSLTVRTEAQLEAEFGSGAGDLTRGGVEVGYGGRVEQAFLAPFDRIEGWVPPGHAWLVLRVEDAFRQPANTSWRAELDAAASWTLAHDAGVSTPAHPPDASGIVTFLVPDDVRAVTLAYRPVGTVGLPPDARYEFRAPEPLTTEIQLP